MWRKELTHLNQQPQIWYKLRKNITITMICSQWCIWPQEKMTSVRAVLQGISAADGITDTVRRSPLWIRSVFTDDEVTSQGITKWQNGRNDLTYLTVHPHDIILHCTIVSAEWNGIFCVTYHTSTAALPLASSFAQSHKGAWKAPLTPIQTSPNEKAYETLRCQEIFLCLLSVLTLITRCSSVSTSQPKSSTCQQVLYHRLMTTMPTN